MTSNNCIRVVGKLIDIWTTDHYIIQWGKCILLPETITSYFSLLEYLNNNNNNIKKMKLNLKLKRVTIGFSLETIAYI